MSAWMDARRILPLSGPKIVTIGLISGTKILTGLRRDNSKWTNPGGHMDEGETLTQAAIRETKEETGITLEETELELISADRVNSYKTGLPMNIFAFIARIPKTKASNKKDPDQEISEWKWVELSPETLELAPKMRHAAHDHVLCHLGFCRSHGRLSRGVPRGTITEKRLAAFYTDDWTEDNTPLLTEVQQTEGQAIDNLKPDPRRRVK